MDLERTQLEARAAQAFRRHMLQPGEASLHEAYEFGRAALDAGLGVIDMAVLLSRVAGVPPGEDPGRGRETGARTEAFLLECLAPFEMAHRGIREANAALRELDERRERDARRLAHELHDEAGQMVPVLGFMIDGLRADVRPEALPKLDRARRVVEELAERLRRLSHELRPVILDDLGLEHAIRFLADGVAERSGLKIRVEGSLDERLPAGIESVLYRAVQESLLNVVRHAQAKQVIVRLVRGEDGLTCRILDDGRGFPTVPGNTSPHARGTGLDAMRERLATVRGNLEVGTGPTGTQLTIYVPLEVAHARSPAHRG